MQWRLLQLSLLGLSAIVLTLATPGQSRPAGASPLQDPPNAPAAASQPASRAATRPKTPDRAMLEREFKQMLDQVTFQGTWRMHRGERVAGEATLGEARSETYTIESADKERRRDGPDAGAVEDDHWIIVARIQFGEADVKLPVRVRVVWAGDTPIITVDEFQFPGMGKYSARVMVYRGYYCGTWFGADYGGVMSGEIVKRP